MPVASCLYGTATLLGVVMIQLSESRYLVLKCSSMYAITDFSILLLIFLHCFHIVQCPFVSVLL